MPGFNWQTQGPLLKTLNVFSDAPSSASHSHSLLPVVLLCTRPGTTACDYGNYRNLGVCGHRTATLIIPSTSRVRECELGDDSIRGYSQLKMPGGGCWVTTGQFSSSLLSPQLFSWLQISEPRRKQFPLVQWNLHSAQSEEARVWEKTCCGRQMRNWYKFYRFLYIILFYIFHNFFVIRECAWISKSGFNLLLPKPTNTHKTPTQTAVKETSRPPKNVQNGSNQKNKHQCIKC